MQLYHVTPEIVSLFLTIVLYIYFISEKDLYRSKQEKQLSLAMIVSIISILNNIISCFLIINKVKTSLILLYFIHSLCFITALLQCTLILRYIVDLVFMHAPKSFYANYFHNITYVVNLINFILILINIKTKCIFSIDSVSFEYIRGPLNPFTLICVFIFIICSLVAIITQRKYQSLEFSRLSKYCTPIIAVITLVQLISKDYQLGGLMALVALIFCVFNLSTNQLLSDVLTGFGNQEIFKSNVSYLFLKKRIFTIIKIRIRSLSEFKKAFDQIETDTLLLDISTRLLRVKHLIKIFRTGDDEFSIIAPGLDEANCTQLAQEVVDVFSEEWIVGNSVIKLIADVIVLACPTVADDFSSVESIFDYIKRNEFEIEGGSNVVLRICDIKTKALISRASYVLNVLKDACINKSFEYYFQPIYKVTGEYSGTAECLIRLYDHNHNTYIPPSEFIPIAEKNGLIGIIGEYVLNAASSLIRKAIDKGLEPPTISVNFSARQLFDVNLVKDVMSTLTKYNIPTNCIKIEITESYLITNYEAVCEVMDELVSKGVGFYLDDFGSGFSNIPHYINLPFECIKYDHSLLKSSAINKKTDNLLKAMTPSFINLGYRIIFEGVEEEDSLSYVASFGDVYVQGYYFSCAMPEEQFETMIGLED